MVSEEDVKIALPFSSPTNNLYTILQTYSNTPASLINRIKIAIFNGEYQSDMSATISSSKQPRHKCSVCYRELIYPAQRTALRSSSIPPNLTVSSETAFSKATLGLIDPSVSKDSMNSLGTSSKTTASLNSLDSSVPEPT